MVDQNVFLMTDSLEKVPSASQLVIGNVMQIFLDFCQTWENLLSSFFHI
jgi:hypothetical protein